VARKRKKERKSKNLLNGLFSNKLFFAVIIFVVISGGVFYGLWQFFHNDQFFKIREISINEEGNYSLWEDKGRIKELYMGRNIFSISPKELEILIKSEAPQLKAAVIRRVMPDRLEIDVIPRRPVAFIDSGDLIIDGEAVVLSAGTDGKDLARVKGIGFFFLRPKVGERIENAMLFRALMLLEGLREKGVSGSFPVDYVDVSDRNDVQLGIRGVVIKMGNEDFPEKIDRLKEILEDPNIDTNDIRYIDLRFETAVISPK
jgi:cell division septal protein FtsQ